MKRSIGGGSAAAVCVLLLAATLGLIGGHAEAAKIEVDLAPYPFAPSEDQCRAIADQNHAALSAAFNEAKDEAWNNLWVAANDAAGWNKVYDENLKAFMLASDEENRRTAKCLRLAAAADQVGGASAAAGLTPSASAAWQSGIGAIPDSSWSSLPSSGTKVVGYARVAAQSYWGWQKLQAMSLRLNFANDLIGVIASGKIPRGDLDDRVSKNAEYAQELLGDRLPLLSTMLTALAVNAVQAIGADATRQLEAELTRFDSAAGMQTFSRAIANLEQNRMSGIEDRRGSADNATSAALLTLDAVEVQIAALGIDLAAIRAAERAAASQQAEADAQAQAQADAQARAREADAEARRAAFQAETDRVNQQIEQNQRDADELNAQLEAQRRRREANFQRAIREQQDQENFGQVLGIIGGIVGALPGRGAGSGGSYNSCPPGAQACR